MNSKILLAFIVVVGCCALEALASLGLPNPNFDINSDLDYIDPNNDVDVQRKFEQFKTLFNKYYATPEEELYRYEIFKENLRRAIEMNANEEDTATYGINKFSDLTEDETPRGYIPQTPGIALPSNL